MSLNYRIGRLERNLERLEKGLTEKLHLYELAINKQGIAIDLLAHFFNVDLDLEDFEGEKPKKKKKSLAKASVWRRSFR